MFFYRDNLYRLSDQYLPPTTLMMHTEGWKTSEKKHPKETSYAKGMQEKWYNTNRPYATTGNTPEKEACIHSGLQVGYTAADRPAWIEEGNRMAEFTYNAQFDRIRMRMAEEGKTVYTRYYLRGNYEAHCDSSGTEERLYVGGDCYEAPVLLVKKEGKTEL